MPKVSIIVPIYNVEQYLARCLNSLINQTLKDIEIICINDCSPDNSLKILEEYQKKDNRIKIIDLKENQGVSVARNKGLEIATGDYLGFVDPDDWIDLNYYEELYNKSKKIPDGIVKCVSKTEEVDGHTVFSSLNEQIMKGSIFDFTYEWTTSIYNRKIIVDNEITFYPNCFRSEDDVFLSDYLLHVNKIILIDNITYHYIKREGSLNSKKSSIESMYSELKAVEHVLQNLEKAYELNKINREDYIRLFVTKMNWIFNGIITQNDEIQAKKACIKKGIELFNKCLYRNELEKFCKAPGYKELYELIGEDNLEEILNIFIRLKDVEKPLEKFFLQKVRNKLRKDVQNA